MEENNLPNTTQQETPATFDSESMRPKFGHPKPLVSILLLILLTVMGFLAYQTLITAGTCQIRGGFSDIFVKNCRCWGKEITLYDHTAIDGYKKTLCLGLGKDIPIAPRLSILPSPTPNPTADWKTYTDNQNKFFLMYPDDKKAVLKTEDAYIGFCNIGASTVSLDLYNQDQQIPSPSVATEFTGFLRTTIAIKTLPSGLSTNEWVQTNCIGSWVIDPSTQINNVLIKGSQATKFTGGQMATGSFVVYPKDTFVYMFYGWPTGSKDSMEIFDQILSTFISCGTCPQFSPPSPDFCKDGKIVDGGKDECGCQRLPQCQKL